MGNNQGKFDTIAQTVLKKYEINEPRLTFIRHSDNVTYKVTSAESNTFLLRIHVPVTTAMGTHGADYDMVNSEVLWLLALDQETNLTLQKPVKNRSDSLVTCLPTEERTTIHCTLLHWIDGKLYHRDLESESTAYQIGTILATLHNHASQWVIPGGFERPRRDIPYFETMLSGLLPAVKDGRISSSDYTELSKSISLLIDMISSLDEGPNYHGIMHADMHKGNMLYHEGNIRLIDFSFCAFGNYMFDLGICLSDMKVELHRFCLDGYQSLRELPENYQQLIEGFSIGSMVGTFSFWVPNPRCQEILVRKVPQITKDFAIKYNHNERFWFSP